MLISTATRHPEILTSEYYRIFDRLGVHDNIHAPLIRNREEALAVSITTCWQRCGDLPDRWRPVRPHPDA